MINDTHPKFRPIYGWFFIVIVMFVSVFILNRVASLYIERNAGKHSKYELSAVSDYGETDYLICHEWDGNPYFDFYFHDVKHEYKQYFNVGSENMDTDAPVRCVRHRFDAVNMNKVVKLTTPKDKVDGEKRLVFIGDSFTYGESAPKGTAYPDAMNNYLRLLGNPEKWNVINFGVIGADMPFIYDFIFKKALETNPDVIVYTWIANDTPFFEKTNELMYLNDLINKRNLVLRVSGQPLLKLIKVAFMDRRLSRGTLRSYTDLNGPPNSQGIAQLREILSAMKSESETAGVDFHVALFPILVGSPGKYPLAQAHSYISEIIDQESISRFDLTESVLRKTAHELWVCPANHHPNVSAHRLAAKALMEYLSISTSYSQDAIETRHEPEPGRDPRENIPRSTDTQCGDAAVFDPKLSPSALRALREEVTGFPPGTSIVTNSAAVYEGLGGVSGKNIFLAGRNSSTDVFCLHGTPCIYLLFIPESIKRNLFLSHFDPSCFSRMTFPEGMFLFMFPEDVSQIPGEIILYPEDICAGE